MQCSRCGREAILYQPYSGQHFCRDHFIADFEAKARREIRKGQGIRTGDRIGVVRAGDAAGSALLLFFENLAGSRRDVRVTGLSVTGSVAEIREAARVEGITRLAFATSLEESSARNLAGILRGDPGTCTGGGAGGPGTLPEVFPFRHLPAEEIALYARIHGIAGSAPAPAGDGDPLLADIAVLLEAYARRHPAAPHAILNLCDALRQTGRPDRGDGGSGSR